MTKLLVTGGSRGIGAALAVAAAQRGWDVALTFNTNEGLAHQVAAQAADLGAGKVAVVPMDVRSSQSVDRGVDQAVDALGGLDAVISNAGISVPGLAYGMTDEDWDRVLDTNLSGSFRVCRAVLPELVANRSGRIVMMSSMVAGGAAGHSAYAASKAGLHGLAMSLAKEYGPKGIMTNVIIPGYFETDMTKETMSEELAKFAVSYCPLRRMGSLDELCRATLFFCEEGGFSNGASLRVTGGLDWTP